MSADNLEQSSSQAKRALNDDSENATSFPLAKRQRTANTSLEGGWLGRTEGRRKLEHADYSVGWICALPIELAASQAMLDEIHQSLPMEAADTNMYTLGSIRGHNITMTCLGQYGTNDAAAVANHMMRSFESIRFGFMVGIGGGAPGETDVRLGDVVVGKHVIQHDLGKFTAGDGFQGIGTAKAPPPILQKAVAKLSALHEANGSGIPILLQEMQQRHPGMAAYAYPTSYEDRLFRATYTHDHPGDCTRCSVSELCRRPLRDDSHPRIHYGGIASGNQVIKCSQKRDYLARKHDAICFEMEAAGLSDAMPSIVIRGICDYSDSHKNKEWQRYAAATAAAYAKELIGVIALSAPRKTVGVGPSEVLEESPEVLQTRRNAFLELLRFEQIDSRHATIKNAHSKTCEWLLQDPSYKQWLDASNSARPCGFFWISGKPGAGKSTLMKFVLSRARRSLGNNDAIISFFFNARGDTLEKSTTGLYRSLLLQLLESFPDLQSVLDDSALISPKQRRCPDIEALQDLFCDAIKSLGERQVTCFIDALDECNEKQVHDMVVFFEAITHEAGAEHAARLKICFSSRHYPHIYVRHGIKLVLEHQTGHKRDLEKYIQSYLRAENDQQVEDVRLRLLEKASGVFMWVVLVVDLVNNVLSRGNWFAVDKLLREIPSGLSELFKDILRRDNDKVDQNQFLLCVQWLLFAKKPLSPQEFHYAVLSGLMEGPQYPAVHNPEKVSPKTIELFVNSSSKGLAEITKSGRVTVQFIHESVRDFFLKENGLRELWPDLGIDFETSSHETLGRHCLSYITDRVCRELNLPGHDKFPRAESHETTMFQITANNRFPFLHYATHHVLHHADIAAKGRPQHDWLESFPRGLWIRLHNLFQAYQNCRYSDRASIVYILADQNYCKLLQEHFRHQCHPIDYDSLSPERYTHPFLAASANRHWDAARIFLGQGADCFENEELFPHTDFEIVGDLDQFDHALSWAIKKRRWATAKLIIDSDHFDWLQSLNSRGDPCIHSAAIAGDVGFMVWLVEKVTSSLRNNIPHQLPPLIAGTTETNTPGYPHYMERLNLINSRNLAGYTPLGVACRELNEDIIRLLLDWGATPSIGKPVEFHFSNPSASRLTNSVAQLLASNCLVSKNYLLSTAVTCSADDTIQCLLDDEGAYTEIHDGGWQIFHHVAMRDREAIAITLLEVIGTRGQIIYALEFLHVAVSRGLSATTKFLLESGAPVDGILAGQHLTPLHVAIVSGHKATIQLLVEYGASVNYRIDRGLDAGRTALHLASHLGYEDVVKLLLDHGASINCDVNRGENERETALHVACWAGHKNVAKVLIEHSASVNYQILRGPYIGTTALHAASSGGFEDVVKLLIEHGANIDIRDDEGKTPLHAASSGGFEDVVKLLVEHGATIDVGDRHGKTPLSKASLEGLQGVVKLLVELGATIDVGDQNGKTPLHEACARGHYGIAKLLLEKGADIHGVCDNHRSTPLHEAAISGEVAIVSLLIKHDATIDSRDPDGRTPFHMACRHGHDIIAKLLLEKSAEIHAVTEFGELTALHLAAMAGAEAVVRLLIEKGADANRRNAFMQTPVDIASLHGHKEVMTLLQSLQNASKE